MFCRLVLLSMSAVRPGHLSAAYVEQFACSSPLIARSQLVVECREISSDGLSREESRRRPVQVAFMRFSPSARPNACRVSSAAGCPPLYVILSFLSAAEEHYFVRWRCRYLPPECCFMSIARAEERFVLLMLVWFFAATPVHRLIPPIQTPSQAESGEVPVERFQCFVCLLSIQVGLV